MISIRPLPTDVLAIIAKEVGNPSTFSRVCKNWQRAQMTAFRLIKNEYRASIVLKTFAGSILDPSSPENESDSSFNLQLVQNVYLKVISQAKGLFGELIIEASLKSFPTPMSVQRLTSIVLCHKRDPIQSSNSVCRVQICGGGGGKPPDRLKRLLFLEDFKKKDDVWTHGSYDLYPKPKIDPAVLLSLQQESAFKVQFSEIHWSGIKLDMSKKLIDVSNIEHLLDLEKLAETVESQPLIQPYHLRTWDYFKNTIRSFLPG